MSIEHTHMTENWNQLSMSLMTCWKYGQPDVLNELPPHIILCSDFERKKKKGIDFIHIETWETFQVNGKSQIFSHFRIDKKTIIPMLLLNEWHSFINIQSFLWWMTKLFISLTSHCIFNKIIFSIVKF